MKIEQRGTPEEISVVFTRHTVKDVNPEATWVFLTGVPRTTVAGESVRIKEQDYHILYIDDIYKIAVAVPF